MVDPAWFFSTLAQATATIIGFLIALAAVVYQLDKIEKRGKTRDLRNSYAEFRELYLPHFSLMSHHFLSLINERLPDDVAESESLEERKDEILTQEFDMPHTICLWSIVRDINLKLKSIAPAAEPENHYLLDHEDLEELENYITEYREHLNKGLLGENPYLVNELSEEYNLDWDDVR